MKRHTVKPISEMWGINVTPIIDVALVLVIILLITAPILSVSGNEVELPGARTRGSDESPLLKITLTSNGIAEIEGESIHLGNLSGLISTRLSGGSGANTLVVVRADASCLHSEVSRLLDIVKTAGASRIAVATTQIEREDKWTLSF